MRILWHSNAPFMKTGYGQQTAIWATRLRDLGHDVAIAGYAGAQHLTIEWDGITVYPAGTQHAIGMDTLGYYYEKHQADLVISLCDAWTLSPKLMRLMNTVCWTPVDADPAGQMLKGFFQDSGARALSMSRYGQRVMAEAGIEAAYVPHGIDTDLFAPPADREALREASGVPKDAFVVFMNQANRSGLRKALPEQLTAFARFWRRHPEARLFMHMATDHPKGQDLPLWLERHGIPDGVVFFPDQGAYAAGEVGMEDMPALYGVADVGLGAAMAGGFELPLLEMQACGVPVIATDGSAMAEVAGPHSWLVPSQPFWVEQVHGADWRMPIIGHRCSHCGELDGIEAALEEAWQDREDGRIEYRRKLSREHALQYDADKILREMWQPYLEGIEASL